MRKFCLGDNFSIARVSNSLTADSALTASHHQLMASNIISLSSALDHSTAEVRLKCRDEAAFLIT